MDFIKKYNAGSHNLVKSGDTIIRYYTNVYLNSDTDDLLEYLARVNKYCNLYDQTTNIRIFNINYNVDGLFDDVYAAIK